MSEHIDDAEFHDVVPDEEVDLVVETRAEANQAAREDESFRFSMGDVVQLLRWRGFHAELHHTGGGCATIFAGPRHYEHGYGPRWAVAAGPGTFTDPNGWDEAFGDVRDFFVGPDDYGDNGIPWQPQEGMGVVHVVHAIVDLAAGAMKQAPQVGVISTIDEFGELVCTCGNRSDLAGFYPCDTLGRECEPARKWQGHYVCAECCAVWTPPKGVADG